MASTNFRRENNFIGSWRHLVNESVSNAHLFVNWMLLLLVSNLTAEVLNYKIELICYVGFASVGPSICDVPVHRYLRNTAYFDFRLCLISLDYVTLFTV